MSVIMLIIIQTKEKMKTSYQCSTHSLCFTTPMLPLPLYPMLYHILMLPLPPYPTLHHPNAPPPSLIRKEKMKGMNTKITPQNMRE